jgi:isopenicillin N synthase-like dioxygenase
MTIESEAPTARIEVPTIDIDRNPLEVGREIDETLRTVGFFQITNHGVSSEIADACWNTTRDFFDLPLAEKLEVERPAGGLCGYFPIKSESLAQSIQGMSAGDLKESFNAGVSNFFPVTHTMADETEAALFGISEWPDALPELRTTWKAYFEEMERLSNRLMSIFALGLDLDEDYFADKIDKSPSSLRAINYPPQDVAPEEGQLRAGAHTDYGTLTILRQEAGRGGLQVRDDKSLSWVDVPATDGAYVINIGDLMARWTNDRWMSTLHRVVNPDVGAASSSRRQSMPFFHNANYSQVVECLPTCIGNGATYEPVLAGPHLAGKSRKSQVDSAEGSGDRAEA